LELYVITAGSQSKEPVKLPNALSGAFTPVISITIGTVNDEPMLGFALDGVAVDTTVPVAAVSGVKPAKRTNNNAAQAIRVNLKKEALVVYILINSYSF